MKLAFIVPVTLLVAACSASTAPQDTAASSDEIRAMTPEEILGEIGYGETQDVELSPSPRYRAFSFKGTQNDQIQAQVISLDATDPVLWITDDQFNIVASNNDARATDLNALVNGKILPKTGTYYIVFREMNGAPKAKFTVAVRKLGAVPAECDPEGEGFVNPDCTDPPDADPFDPASCSGEPLTAASATALFGGQGGLRLAGSKIYYRTRQCSVKNGDPECTPWVRAFSMDVRLGAIVAATPELAAAGAPFTIMPTDATRKTKVDFGVDPVATKAYCVDGPFAIRNVRNPEWAGLADGTPGVCGDKVTTIATGTCTRIEPAPIQLSSGDPTYYTEFSSVLFAKY